jgi:hypothetical protein
MKIDDHENSASGRATDDEFCVTTFFDFQASMRIKAES